MSIYASWLTIDDEDHEPECAKWRKVTKDQALSKPSYMSTWGDDYYVPVKGASCTCGNPGPVIYQGSHVNPSNADPRGGSLDVGSIPNHCHPDARHDGETDDMTHRVDFLRLSLVEDPATYHGLHPGHATVVLDRAQVERLRDTLTYWLDTEERW